MKNNRNLFYLANSFSEDSGGRTQATFTRAKMLSDVSANSFILTFNFKRDYGEIYHVVKEKRGIPSSITFLNMFEFFAGEELYNNREEQPAFFNKDSQFIYEFIAKKNAYKVYNKGVQFCYIQLDKYGTCIYKDFFDDKKRKIKRETYDYYGKLKLITYLNMLTKKPLRKIYYTNKQRAYLCIDYDRENFNTKQCIVYDKDEKPCKVFLNELEMAKYWIANLNALYLNSIFFVEDRKLDEVVTNNSYSSKKINSIAVIHSSHLKAPYNFGAKINRFNGDLLKDTSNYSAVVLLTEQQLKHVRNQFGLQPNLYHIPHVKVEQKKSYHEEKDIYKIVVISRFVKIKRIMDILKAFKIVVEKVPNIKLEIWGSGEEEEKYKKFIEENQLQEVVFIKGYTNYPHEVFYSAGLSVITSEYEGFGMTILESMTNQTPVIAYDFNYGPKELIDDGINGYIVENGNINELANQIIEIYNGKNDLKSIGIAAKEKATMFNEAIIKKRWLQMINDVENRPFNLDYKSLRQVVLLSEIKDIYKNEDENDIELCFTIQNTLTVGLPNEKYYLYISNYYNLEQIGNRYFELQVVENSKENFEILKGCLTIEKTIYYELKELDPKFSLGIKNKENFYFIDIIGTQTI
ncbi:glycosyltransferase [Tetragenococcus solitarius]|uniref:Glycosyltransferase n=1 Tax=Tetragenococcus solitarius TaxID=71453 RepID=A0ABP6KKC6_9ENTE|nr:glycosyltransferase [Tetragenococcus solitarius]